MNVGLRSVMPRISLLLYTLGESLSNRLRWYITDRPYIPDLGNGVRETKLVSQPLGCLAANHTRGRMMKASARDALRLADQTVITVGYMHADCSNQLTS